MLWYLATPYTKHPEGLVAAFEHAARAAATLMKRGLIIYSPIAHTHPIASLGNIDLTDHDYWMKFDDAMINACDALFVVLMPGWEFSHGIQHEIVAFDKAGKPIKYLSWPGLEERDLRARRTA